MLKTDYIRIRKTMELKSQARFAIYQILADSGLLGLLIFGLHHRFGLWTAPLIPVLMFRNFSLMHDAVHGSACPQKNRNFWIGTWAGALNLLPFEAWKYSHLQHHFWSGNIDKDPVMALRRRGLDPKNTLFRFLNLCWRLWIPALGVAQNILFWILALQQNPTERKLEYRVSLAAPLLFWSALLGFAFYKQELMAVAVGLYLYYLLAEIVNFPHHLETPVVHGDVRVPVWEQELSARTCVYPKWFARSVVLNFNYHAEHHLFPDVAWYHLAKLHQRLNAEQIYDLISDKNMSWILKNRRRNLIAILQSDKLDAERFGTGRDQLGS